MHLEFLKRGARERGLFFERVAQQRGVSPVLVEKDFWVCWMLAILFESRFGDHFVFKGGTSLSKVFHVIDRFSEDIDLSLSPAFLGLEDVENPAALSASQAEKWMKTAEAACARAVDAQIRPELGRAIASVLGESAEPRLAFEVDATTHAPVILFRYPTTQSPGFDYLRRSVKLEFGSLTDQRPVGQLPARPWLAEDFPEAFRDWRCEVVCLDLRRSFWEKATILHVEHHRPEDKPMPDRFSRHYADTAAIARHPNAAEAVDQGHLRDRVVAWKSRFFRSGWARYDLARPGSFRLVPPRTRIAALRADYRAMTDMYLAEPSDFAQILETLGELEMKINGD